MKLQQVTQFFVALLAFEICVLGSCIAQPAARTPFAPASALLPMSGGVTPVRAFPAVHLTRGLQLTYWPPSNRTRITRAINLDAPHPAGAEF